MSEESNKLIQSFAQDILEDRWHMHIPHPSQEAQDGKVQFINSLFNEAWTRLADQGRCDGWGGTECERVHGQWVEAGCPVLGLDDFIHARINAGPSSPLSGGLIDLDVQAEPYGPTKEELTAEMREELTVKLVDRLLAWKTSNQQS